jgi:antitoxin CcdA
MARAQSPGSACVRFQRRFNRLSRDRSFSQEARELGVEVSRLTELGPEAAMRMVHMRRRQKENADAIEAYNRFIDEHGIPFEEQRKF